MSIKNVDEYFENYEIVEKMSKYIVNYVKEKKEIWTGWETKEEVIDKLKGCENVLETIKEKNLDFDNLYRYAFVEAASYARKHLKYTRIMRLETEIMERMAEHIIICAETGAWADREEIEEVKEAFKDCDNILEIIDKTNLDFYNTYKTALDLALAYHRFYYKIVLSYYDNSEFGHLHNLAWYSKYKDKLVEKFYADDNHSEYYTKEEIYKMIERVK